MKAWSRAPLPLQTAGIGLLVLGLLKLYAAAVPGMVPMTHDAVIPIPLRWLALIMGLLEVQFAVLIGFALHPLRGAQGMTLVGAGFIGYRWLHALAAGPSCPCLAGATSLLPILRRYEDNLLLALAVWFFLIGAWSWAMESKAT